MKIKLMMTMLFSMLVSIGEVLAAPTNSPSVQVSIEGAGQFVLLEFRSLDEMSRGFHYDLQVLSNTTIDSSTLVGRRTIINYDNGVSTNTNIVSGIVTSAGSAVRFGTAYFRYSLVIEPILALDNKGSDYAIHQDTTVDNLVTMELNKMGITNYQINLNDNYSPRKDSVTQYQESGFAFISRLMEQEGIFYFYDYDKLIIGDYIDSYVRLSNGNVSYSASNFNFNASGVRPPRISEIVKTNNSNSRLVTVRGFDFKRAKAVIEETSGQGEQETYIFDNSIQDREQANRASQSISLATLNEFYTMTATDELQIHAGSVFNVTGHYIPNFNTAYVAIKVERHLVNIGTFSKPRFDITSTMIALPATTRFSPERLTPIPRAKGLATAIVVGPSGETRYTDSYGRIKVQFFWDREGKFDENSSAWVRVMTPPDKNRGYKQELYIPQVGTEVVLDFVNGDPSYPIVIGSIYNSDNQAPRPLPSQKDQTYWGGSIENSDITISGGPSGVQIAHPGSINIKPTTTLNLESPTTLSIKGSVVLLNGDNGPLPAARVSDLVAPSGNIISGSPTVLIGH